MSVQTFPARYEPIVNETLETLSAPDQSVVYEVFVSSLVLHCGDEDHPHVHEVPALSVVWTVRDESSYDIANLQIPLIPEPLEISDLQAKVIECWEEMTFGHQVQQMADLDHAMDAILNGDEPI